MTRGLEPNGLLNTPHDVSVRRWLLIYLLFLLALGAPTLLALRQLGHPWQELFTKPGEFIQWWQQATKLLIMMLYLSVCTTFLPMSTGWLAAGMATRHVALAPNLWATAGLIGLAGAIGSTMANLTDYHLFMLLLRHHRIAAVRKTRLYERASKWLTRCPFFIITVFNVIPIPVDVIRVLAVTYGYRRVPFAAANFLGRFIRYSLLAGITYTVPQYQTHVVLAMFAVALGLGLGRLFPPMARRIFRKPKPPAECERALDATDHLPRR